MSDVQFTLELVDQITGPAKIANEHLKKLQDQAKAAGKALDFSDQAKKSIEDLARIKLDPKGFIAAHEAAKKLADEQRKLIRSHEGFFGGLKSAVMSPFGSMTSAVALGELAGEGIIKAGEFLVESAVKVGELIKEGIAYAFESAGKEEHLRTSFKYIFGGAEQAKQVLEQAEKLAERLPYDSFQTAGMLGDLGKVGIKGQSATNALALSADVGAVNGPGGTAAALEALQRMKMQGMIEARSLNALLVDQKEFYKVLGKRLGVSADEARKRASTFGGVGFNTALNAMMETRRSQTGQMVGSAAVEQSRELLARWEKIKDLPEEYLRSIAGSSGWHRLSETLGGVLDRLDPKKHPEIVNALMNAFNALADKAASMLTPENIDRFAKALASLPDTLKSIGESLNTALKAAEALAVIFGARKLVGGAVAASEAAPAIATAAGVAVKAASRYAGPLALATVAQMSGDSPGQQQAMQDEQNRQLQSGQLVEHKHLFGLFSTYERAPAGAPAGTTPQVNIGSPQININVESKDGQINPDDLHRMGQNVHQETAKALERAAQEAGAQ